MYISNTSGHVAPPAEGFKDYEQSPRLFFLVRRAKWLERFYAKINVQTVTVERLATPKKPRPIATYPVGSYFL